MRRRGREYRARPGGWGEGVPWQTHAHRLAGHLDVLIRMLMHLWLHILVGLISAALQPGLRISPIASG